jgi:hypothetical protein
MSGVSLYRPLEPMDLCVADCSSLSAESSARIDLGPLALLSWQHSFPVTLYIKGVAGVVCERHLTSVIASGDCIAH